ncbi:MAG: 30S ribosomal protein S20 [Candidatus Margulisbacteria bacterium]|nr:30S ribosomal protein S20 [Candidatus Margulisiibacteriota bacterium]
MANSKSAIKRIEIAQRNKEINASQESKMKSSIIKAITAITAKDEKSNEILKNTIKVVDTVATKGVIHKNKANRIKSRLTKKLNKIAE